ncbi:esterase-like activity of phytase family protein [Larsenimonas salina]|uniref:esterase-like activity of phytase family protein n=1 Tax=Larsenimonas salina TaxID=1295565 RepID=UPI0020735EA9|nr:esterase-like activity of phytase family protein [Larsenimonas salina]MCM5704548.1 esterase-like activity of phytase family protein [Larsenimonas salina]
MAYLTPFDGALRAAPYNALFDHVEPFAPPFGAITAPHHRLTDAGPALPDTDAPRVQDVEFLGMTNFDSGMQFEGTTVGGLSGLTYLPASDSYLAISDDRSELNEARFYALRVDLGDGHLDDGDVRFTDVTTLRQNGGAPFAEGTIDPEAIDVSDDGTLYISSEGDARQGLAPSVGHYGRDGQQIGALELPQALMPDGEETAGIRNNLALESVTLTPDHTRLFTATENALVQDGPAASANTGSPARLLEFELGEDGAQHAYVYPTEPIPERPASDDGFSTNGLVELLALDDDHLLALERGFAEGVGNTIRLYEIDTERATDIQGLDALPEAGTAVRPVDKTLVADLGAFGFEPDNVEGMAFGPMLEDGRQSLILVSDDNFSDTQSTQFIALGLDVAPEAPTIPSMPTFDLSAFDAAIGRTLDLAGDALAPLFATAFGAESTAVFDGIEASASTLSGAFDFSAAGLEPLGLAPAGAEAFDLWGM